jgi:hypothetical protein
MMVGIGLFIAYDSMLAGMDRLSIDSMISYSSSFLKVRTYEYAPTPWAPRSTTASPIRQPRRRP